MLVLALTTDKLQVITGQAVTVDVHASHVDYASGAVTPGKTNTAITTATTTDVVAAPAASTQRNVRQLVIRNKSTSASVDVTVQYNQNATLFELIKITLAAGDTLEYAEGYGFFKIPNPVNAPLPNVSTADQVVGASTTAYLANSDLRISAGRPLRVGSVLRWHIGLAKSAAATATMTFDLRVGTAGTTGDTSRGSLATGTQTGVADQGELFVNVTIRSISATGTLDCLMTLNHNLAATGLGPTNVITSDAVSGTFDTTATNLIFGLSLTTGASHSITFRQINAEFLQGTI